MKLVLRIGSHGLTDDKIIHTLASAVSDLVFTGHQVTIVHGGSDQLPAQVSSSSSHHHAGCAQHSTIDQCDAANKRLITIMRLAGLQALGLCGADANLAQTRKSPLENGTAAPLEIVSVNPFWLRIIAAHQGVSVLASVALGPDGKFHVVDTDQLASVCAVHWKADVLIFLIRSEGIKTPDGLTLRWLNSREIEALSSSSALPSRLLSKLTACQNALRHGVSRTRLLPFSHIESLSMFYSARIDAGTEVVMSEVEGGKQK